LLLHDNLLLFAILLPTRNSNTHCKLSMARFGHFMSFSIFIFIFVDRWIEFMIWIANYLFFLQTNKNENWNVCVYTMDNHWSLVPKKDLTWNKLFMIQLTDFSKSIKTWLTSSEGKVFSFVYFLAKKSK